MQWGSLLLNIVFNDFFYLILIVLPHNIADKNTFSHFAKTTGCLNSILESENETTTNCYEDNHSLQIPLNFGP